MAYLQGRYPFILLLVAQLLSEHLLCARRCAQCRAYRGERGTFFHRVSRLGGRRTVKGHTSMHGMGLESAGL